MTIKAEELLPCPFCGGEPQIIERKNMDYKPPGEWSFSFDAPEGYSIACTNKMCGMQPGTAPAKQENLFMFYKNWNTRADLAVELGKTIRAIELRIDNLKSGGDVEKAKEAIKNHCRSALSKLDAWKGRGG